LGLEAQQNAVERCCPALGESFGEDGPSRLVRACPPTDDSENYLGPGE
jgi:hypothetical protein